MSGHVSSRIHLFEPTKPSDNQADVTYIIYFITGNPGLIEYYRTFLTHLYGLLTRKPSSASKRTCFHVFGRSLSGFEVEPRSTDGETKRKKPPYGLLEQIQDAAEGLEGLVRAVRKSEGAKDVRAILIGHSVGAYILFEVVRRMREDAVMDLENSVRVVGGICLFPTVTHIAKSASGKKSSWLLNTRPFARVASLFAKVLTMFIPTSSLSFLVRNAMSFPPDAAKVTAAFIHSRHGIHQALHMARDEMQQITSDTWDAEIWGAAHPTTHRHPRPILRFLFAKKDHWVADETRDDLIRARGALRRSKDGEDEESEEENEVEEWRPVMEIDEDEGWQHGFCIRHSVPVAEKVCRYVSEIVGKDLARG